MTHSDAREEIIRTLRKSLRREALPPETLADLQNRLLHPERGVIPRQAQGTHAALVERFTEKAVAAQASVAHLSSLEQVPRTVALFAREHSFPARALLPHQSRLHAMEWAQAEVETATGSPARNCPLGVTACFAAIAESGTVMVHSGPGHPHALHIVPETLLVVVTENQIVGAYEDALDLARARLRHNAWPRIISWITGPSRTADIAGVILFGAHGSRRIHILLIDSDDPCSGEST